MSNRRWQVPPPELLVAFEAAARHLSFTRAGAELFLTQSAVSRQVQALEASLGVRLFERRTRALLLTESGQVLYRAAQQVLQTLHDTAQKLRGEAAVRTVMVTTTPGFAALWLIPRLARFTARHPGVDVRISATYEPIPLERAGVDLAVRYAEASAAPGAKPLFGEQVLPVCSPALAADPARPLREPADLARHTLLHIEGARAPWVDWDLWLHALGLPDLKPSGTLHFSHYDQLVQAAVDGQGVALGRLPLLRQILREGRLVAPFGRAVASSRAYYLVRSQRAAGRGEVQAFASWLEEETAKDSAEADLALAARAAGATPAPRPRRSRRRSARTPRRS
jgi:LysR family glycine cleavage system transcriptional activator